MFKVQGRKQSCDGVKWTGVWLGNCGSLGQQALRRIFMKLSVVIPCLNAAETIGVQLDALRRQKWSERWEVIIADNGSTDATVSVIEANANGLPNLQIID